MNGYKIGYVYLDIAPLKETKKENCNLYDWDNKLNIKLDRDDLNFLIFNLKYQTPFASRVCGKCTFTITSLKNKHTEIKLNDGDVQISYILSKYSHDGLILLLEQANIKIHGWG